MKQPHFGTRVCCYSQLLTFYERVWYARIVQVWY
jgi:hypothetical protein